MKSSLKTNHIWDPNIWWKKMFVNKYLKYWETLPSGPINGRGQDPWYGRGRSRGSYRGWRGPSWGSTSSSSSSSLSSLSASIICSYCSLSVLSKNIWRVIIFLTTGGWSRCWGGTFNVAQTNSVYWFISIILVYIDHIGLYRSYCHIDRVLQKHNIVGPPRHQ